MLGPKGGCLSLRDNSLCQNVTRGVMLDEDSLRARAMNMQMLRLIRKTLSQLVGEAASQGAPTCHH